MCCMKDTLEQFKEEHVLTHIAKSEVNESVYPLLKYALTFSFLVDGFLFLHVQVSLCSYCMVCLVMDIVHYFVHAHVCVCVLL